MSYDDNGTRNIIFLMLGASQVEFFLKVFTVFFYLKVILGTSLAVQWLTPHFHFRGTGSIPGRGTRIPHAAQHSQKKKKKEFLFIKEKNNLS